MTCVRLDGSSQGIVPDLFPRNSNMVIHGAITATVSSVLLSHGLTSAGLSTIRRNSFCWEQRAQALATNEDFRSLNGSSSMIWSMSS